MALNNKGLSLILFTALISGVSIFINSFGVKGFDSSVFTFSKNVVVAMLLLAVVLGSAGIGVLRRLTARQWGTLAIIGLVGGSIPFLLFFKGLQMTAGTTAAFIHKTLFVFVAVFALLWLKERPSKGFFLGAVAILAGTYLMIRPDFSLSIGHLLVLGATVFWAAENTIAKKAVKEMSGTVVAFGRMFFGSIFILASLAVSGKASLVVAMSASQYMWILVTAGFLFLYVFSYYNGIRHIRISTAAAMLSLGAPVTASFAWAFKGIVPSTGTALGMLLIVLGVVAVVWLAPILSWVVRASRVGSDGRH
ncbi:MAG: DMT family transporter [archaeon]